jgi:hypothetical protein
MPNWQPKWDDVQFDHAEVNEAVLLCQGALITLADRHAVLQGPYQMACVQWRGVKRYRFDAEWSAMHVQAEGIAEQLRAHIVKLQHDSSAALIEQRTREAERARWFREKAIEDAAAAAAREAARIAAAQAAAAAAAQAAAQAAAAAAQRAASAASAASTSSVSTQSAAAKPALTFAPISSAPASPAPSPAAAPVSNATSTPAAATETSKPTITFSPVTRASGQLSGR